MISKLLLTVIFLFSFYICGLCLSPKVSLKQGIVKGFTRTSDDGSPYNVFLGIPYGAPPVGDLRFQDPQPSANWAGTFSATTLGPSCPQLEEDTYVGDEDCLYLNIYTPGTVTEDSKLPVMFWIHGGGFNIGEGGPNLYGPDYIIEQNVILVTINYRLGALGFMTVYNENDSGNMGIKDQLLALQWVKQHIEVFGGDPESITIFGESAGGRSVEMLMLSPKSEGLFKRAIVQSGPIVSDLVFRENADQYAYHLGLNLGINTNDSNELLTYLKNVSAENITRISMEVINHYNEPLIFGPVIERNSSKEPVLTKHPRELFISEEYKPVNEILYGTVSQEGLLGSLMDLSNTSIDWVNASVETLVPDFEKFIPKEINDAIDTQKRPKAAGFIKDFYFPNNNSVLNNFIDLQSDFYFNKDLQFSFGKMLKKVQSAFYYTFSYHGGLNAAQKFIPFEYTGAAHADELGYLFTGIYGSPNEEESLTIKRMVEMWTNFAKHGNPTPNATEAVNVIWKPATEKNFYYLDIGSNLTLGENPLKDRMEFWNNLEHRVNSGQKYQMNAAVVFLAVLIYCLI